MSFFWEDKDKKYLKKDLLSGVAEEKAKMIYNAGVNKQWQKSPKKNTHTQIRKFFDEVITYKTQCIANSTEDFFKQQLPYIKMINAKMSYSQARGFIDEECLKFFTDLINSIEDRKDFMAFADFFEAFIAYYRQYDK